MKTGLPFKLTRPLAAIDIESTGTSPRADRIVELAVLILAPDGTRNDHVFRVNPGVPIPPAASAIHGIYDADVADAPPFAQIASEVAGLLDGCDLLGFNHVRYDVPMLIEEFARVGTRFDVQGVRMIDVQRIYHRREPRDLTAAVAFYCNDVHTDAHGAQADAEATLRVLAGQFEKYPDLPRDLDALDRYCNTTDPSWVERTGKLKWTDGQIVLNFGKKKGIPLRQLIAEDPGFIQWMLKNDFSREVRDIVSNAVEGRWPSVPDEST